MDNPLTPGCQWIIGRLRQTALGRAQIDSAFGSKHIETTLSQSNEVADNKRTDSVLYELTAFSSTNAEIDLKYHESKKTDEFGNQFRYRSRLRTAKGDATNKWIVDVFLAVGEAGAGGDNVSMLKSAGAQCKPPAQVSTPPAQ